MMYKKQFNVNLSDDIIANGNIIINGNDSTTNFNVISSIVNQLLKNDATIEYITNNTITSDFVNVVNMHNSKESCKASMIFILTLKIILYII